MKCSITRYLLSLSFLRFLTLDLLCFVWVRLFIHFYFLLTLTTLFSFLPIWKFNFAFLSKVIGLFYEGGFFITSILKSSRIVLLSSIHILYFLFRLGLLWILPLSTLGDFAPLHDFIYTYYSHFAIVDGGKFCWIVFYSKWEAHFPSYFSPYRLHWYP